jgi:hypothetical protein
MATALSEGLGDDNLICNIGEPVQPVSVAFDVDENNAAFIAAARTALPILIELCEAQQKLIEAAESALEPAREKACPK